jgi:hypothetical protein
VAEEVDRLEAEMRTKLVEIRRMVLEPVRLGGVGVATPRGSSSISVRSRSRPARSSKIRAGIPGLPGWQTSGGPSPSSR